MAIGEKGQSNLWLNPRMLPSLGSVGIQLGTCNNQKMGFLLLVQSTHDLSWDLHSVSVVLLVRVCYVHTRPLGFQHNLSECLDLLYVEVPGENLSRVNNTALPWCDVHQGDVCSGNPQDFSFRGAI